MNGGKGQTLRDLKDYCRIQADVVLVSSMRAFMPGQVVIRRGRIVEVTGNIDETPDICIDNGVLLPGLVNPHTHLEFSDLANPLPAGKHFPDWIQNVLAARLRTPGNDRTRAESIRLGLSESNAVGVVALGDIITPHWQPASLTSTESVNQRHASIDLDDHSRELLSQHIHKAGRTPHVVAFIEQLGLSAERREKFTLWRDELMHVASENWPESLEQLAFSPHAPYSTPPELWRDVARLAAHHKVPLAMHVLESPAERQWMDEGTGPMAEMLAGFGAANWRLPTSFIDDLCLQLNQGPSALMVHGNYLSEAELDIVAAHKNICLVYCPRTHAHFQHKTYPLESITKRGIRLSIGTDSRSTNPDLNLWQDARTAWHMHKSLSPSAALAAITELPAQALQLDKDFGSLQTGRAAALNLIKLERSNPRDLERVVEYLFETAAHPHLL